jgi:hypothetical protein
LIHLVIIFSYHSIRRSKFQSLLITSEFFLFGPDLRTKNHQYVIINENKIQDYQTVLFIRSFQAAAEILFCNFHFKINLIGRIINSHLDVAQLRHLTN